MLGNGQCPPLGMGYHAAERYTVAARQGYHEHGSKYVAGVPPPSNAVGGRPNKGDIHQPGRWSNANPCVGRFKHHRWSALRQELSRQSHQARSHHAQRNATTAGGIAAQATTVGGAVTQTMSMGKAATPATTVGGKIAHHDCGGAATPATTVGGERAHHDSAGAESPPRL
ncbi:hypothetical protein PoB_005223900 [Plakobranchus ocellatus]|uniref:Uncharacterized protein n=1 Tax=Plakobranchus ocellatus TaxID=259542 RepID=A0AAV4C3M9_9GAST|nr:hypothetical protein PoB_005223900 [Plakobranchus ocellatus]